MEIKRRPESQYDLPTAITFLMAGLGIGSFLAILFAPSPKSMPSSTRVRSSEPSASAV